MRAEIVRLKRVTQKSETEELVLQIEQARDQAMAGEHKFLAYLLGMARIEAAAILEAEQR